MVTSKYQKAWDEIDLDPNIQIMEKLDGSSRFYIGPGVKIERFKDGKIELKSIYTRGDWYNDFPAHQLRYFEDYGFWVGLYKVNSDYFGNKLIDADDAMRVNKDPEQEQGLKEQYGTAQERLNKYEKLLRNALKREGVDLS